MIADVIGTVLIIISALLALACVVSYAYMSGGAWRDTKTGRHLMAFMFVICAVLILSTIRGVFINMLQQDEAFWFHVLRIAVFAFVPVVLAWRLKLILFSNREDD